MFNLNPQQQLAVQSPTDKPLLIVAGAGTGKTKTLTSRLRRLIDDGVPPSKICALTFTNKAAEEMAARVRTMTNNHNNNHNDNNDESGHRYGHGHDHDDALAPFIGTFHSLCARILRKEANNFCRTPDFVIFDDDDSFRLIKKICKEVDAENENDWQFESETEMAKTPAIAKTAKGPAAVAKKISRIKSGSLALEALYDSRRAEDLMAAEVFGRYEESLQRQNAFDFDDLIAKVVGLWKKNPAILQKYRNKFSHILVDEYQDLNNIQYEFVKFLAGPAPKLSVVGDDQQTIYSWRGSNFEIFLNFEKEWPESNVVFLEENYRSTPNIIEAASAMIGNNRRQKPKTLWTRNPNGPKIQIFKGLNEDAEAGWVGEGIAEFLVDEAAAHNDHDHDHDHDNNHDDDKNHDNDTASHGYGHGNSMAVLYRTNAQSFPIEQKLLEMEIPYRIFGGLKFYERKEIKDIVSGLRYFLNPNDEISKERLQKNFRRTGFARIETVAMEATGLSPAQLIPLFLRAADYSNYILKNFTNPEERQENIAELIRFAEKFETLPEMLEQISLASPSDAPSLSNFQLSTFNFQPVSLMSIHLAKGLEFDHVFVVGCSEGLLPHARSYEREKDIEEERRLMYVAMTRAKKSLHVSCYDVPSRFIYEIPREYVEFVNGELREEEENYIQIE